jgi:hypothetical protein
VVSGRANEWPAEAAMLLARCVNEMQRRLRPIRDSAAWRIIDSAKSIQKAITEKEMCDQGSPWEQVGCEEGKSTLCRSLCVAEIAAGNPDSAAAKLEPDDAALCFTSLLDRLAGIVTDMVKLVDDGEMPDTGGLSYILDEVLQTISYVQEDLLAVLDDATEESLAAWLSNSWSQWGEAGAGSRLEAAMSAMPLKADAALQADKRQSRRSQLALMRGLQTLLADGRFRAQLLDLAAPGYRAPLDGSTQSKANVIEIVSRQALSNSASVMVDFEALALRETPADSSIATSPRGLYVPISPKPEKFTCEEEEIAEPRPAAARADGEPLALKSRLPTEVAPPLAPSEEVWPCAQSDPLVAERSLSPVLAPAEAPSPAPKKSSVEYIVTPFVPSPSPPRHQLQEEKISPRAAQDPPAIPSPRKHSSSTAGQRESSKGQAVSTTGAGATSLVSATLPAARGAPDLPPTPGRPSASARPKTPSWLEPPWARQAQEVPFNSWSRPGTPSTVCDETDLAQAPKYKVVDGQCIPLRPASSSMRLPPIHSGYPLANPGGRKGAW